MPIPFPTDPIAAAALVYPARIPAALNHLLLCRHLLLETEMLLGPMDELDEAEQAVSRLLGRLRTAATPASKSRCGHGPLSPPSDLAEIGKAFPALLSGLQERQYAPAFETSGVFPCPACYQTPTAPSTRKA